MSELSKQPERNTDGVLFSIVIPVYNATKYLEDCLNSISSQSLSKELYEIVCVEDCSTDKSYDLLMELGKNIENIRIFKNEENLGQAPTRNVGLGKAVGKYVWFVDDDDIIYPNVLESIAELLLKNEPDALICDFKKIDGNYKLRDCKGDIKFGGDYFECDSLIKNAPCNIETQQHKTYIWCCMYRKDFMESHNMDFDEDMPICEDIDFFVKWPKVSKIIKADLLCYLYRDWEGSTVHLADNYKKGYYSSIRILEKYVERNKDTENIENNKEYQNDIATFKHNIANTLVQVKDINFVKDKLGYLKSKGYYPYPFNFAVFNSKEPIFKKLALFVLPIKPLFILINKLYGKINK
ncbi:MAG: glycosyltransferase family 2 protein [Ruminococcaceae bacterium]|nr:glycosyltransferase family 2 protein [Oscillospiraceae bacterium]